MTDELIIWDDLKGKEARGITKDVDLGEVQEVGKNFVLTQKGTLSKEKFYIPKYLVNGYDGDTLWFNISEGDKSGFRRDSAPTYEEYVRYRTDTAPSDVETHVRIIKKRDSTVA
jgi:hypothetical protein